MTTEDKKIITNKIKAHLIEYPDDPPREIAKLFDVPAQRIHTVKETLRRHKMIARKGKKPARAKVLEPIKVVHIPEITENQYVTQLRDEIKRLNVIISYLEQKVGKVGNASSI